MASNVIPEMEKILDSDEYIECLNTKELIYFMKEYMAVANVKTKQEMILEVKLYAAKKREDLRDKVDSTIQGLQNQEGNHVEELVKLVQSLQTTLLPSLEQDKRINDLLNFNLPNYVDNIEQRLNMLKVKYISVVIMGEPSAGKTSFINLLLGEEILKPCHMSNTIVMCEISYGERYEAKVYSKTGKIENVTVNNSITRERNEIRSDFCQELAKYIQKMTERKDLGYTRAEIHVPCEVLKSGLRIVDSPGVGEHNDLTEMVVDYMLKSFAFIYVINSFNAGGLEGKHLLKLFERLWKEREKENCHWFLPQSSIFVCNKWDLVACDNRDEVLESTRKNLRDMWENVRDDHIFTISTPDSMFLNDRGYVSRQLMKVLEGFKKIIPSGSLSRISYICSYITRLLSRTEFTAKTLSRYKSVSRERSLEKVAELIIRMAVFANEFEAFFKEQRMEVLKLKEDIVNTLHKDLNKKHIISDICSFEHLDIPALSSWEDIKNYISTTLSERIGERVKRFEKDNQIIHKSRTELLKKFCENFMILQEEMEREERAIVGGCDETETEEQAITDGSNETSNPRQENVTAPIWVWVPLAVFAITITIPIPLIMSVFGSSSRDKERDFKKNPVKFLQSQSHKLCKSLLKKPCINEWIASTSGLSQVYEYIDYLEKEAIRQVNSDLKLLESISCDLEAGIVSQDDYTTILTMCSEFKEQVKNITKKSMRQTTYDVQDTAFVDLPLDRIKLSDAALCWGLNADITKGSFCDSEGTRRYVTRRRPNSALALSKEVYLEEEKAYWNMRTEDNVIQILSSKMDMNQAIQIFEDFQYNLRDHIEKNRLILKAAEWKSLVKDVLLSVVLGLQRLHDSDYVHFDLSMASIAVTSDGQVKLTNISRKKRPENVQGMLDSNFDEKWIYIPPDAIYAEQSYDETSDIYAFGLMLWEMFTGRIAFRDQVRDPTLGIRSGLNFFVWLKETDIISVLHVDGLEEVDLNWKNFMKKCLRKEPDALRTYETMELLK